jgi:hypothetical protein
MNVLLHFLLNYLVINSVLGNASNYIIYILIFSIIVDIDHIPYILKVKKNLVHKKFGSESRSRFHELYGLTLFSLGISIFSFLDIILIEVIALSVVLHYATDFLLGKTRPFYPFSKKEVFLHISLERYRIPFEITLTLILSVILWLTIN